MAFLQQESGLKGESFPQEMSPVKDLSHMFRAWGNNWTPSLWLSSGESHMVWLSCSTQRRKWNGTPKSILQWTSQIIGKFNERDAVSFLNKVVFVAWFIWKARNERLSSILFPPILNFLWGELLKLFVNFWKLSLSSWVTQQLWTLFPTTKGVSSSIVMWQLAKRVKMQR